MAKAAAKPKKPTRTPTGRWAYYLVAMPWLQLVTGVILILFASRGPQLLSLFDGAVISLYAVSLLAGTVCAFGSPTPPKISKRLMIATDRVFQIVVVISVVLVVLTQTGNILSTEVFVASQGMLVLIAFPFAWRARA